VTFLTIILALWRHLWVSDIAAYATVSFVNLLSRELKIIFSPHEQRKIKAAKARKKKLELIERQKCLKNNYMKGKNLKSLLIIPLL